MGWGSWRGFCGQGRGFPNPLTPSHTGQHQAALPPGIPPSCPQRTPGRRASSTRFMTPSGGRFADFQNPPLGQKKRAQGGGPYLL